MNLETVPPLSRLDYEAVDPYNLDESVLLTNVSHLNHHENKATDILNTIKFFFLKITDNHILNNS